MKNLIIGLIMTILASFEACQGMTCDVNRTDFQNSQHIIKTIDINRNLNPDFQTENNDLPFLVGDSFSQELIGKEIFFPQHWEQMSDETIASWCCAGSQDELITEKYLAMFGLQEWNGEYLKLVTNENGDACKIIDFGPLDENIPEDKKFKSDFIEIFRRMASNLEGRVLLYRTFIEIQRTDEFGQGTIGQDAKEITTASKLAKLIEDRNKLRHIVIQRFYKNIFKIEEGYIGFSPSDDQRTTNAVGRLHWGKADIKQESRTDDVGLNHEMTHWFHILRHPERAFEERNIKIEEQDIPRILVGREKVDLWLRPTVEGDIFVNMEDHRTIMGGNENVVFKTFF